MNKHPFAIIAMALIAMSACSEKQKTIPADDAATIAAAELPELVDTISVDIARHYVNNYAARAGKLPVTGQGTDTTVSNTRAVWFDIAKIKALVANIEAQGGDGIRFYFAAYDSSYAGVDSTQVHIPDVAYWNRNTLVMVPTFAQGPYHFDYYGSTPTARRVNGKTSKGSTVVVVAPLNRGELCPPPANCKGVGADLVTD